MELKIIQVIKSTPPELTLGSLPFYQFNFEVGGEWLRLIHQFEYNYETFDQTDLDDYNRITLCIENLLKTAKLRESNTIGFGTKLETFVFE